MGLFQRIRDDARRKKAVKIRQEIANHLVINPQCSDYENVFAQVQPIINEMVMIRPFGVGRNGGELPMARTPEIALLDTPNDEMGWGEFAGAMFATWLTEDELDIHVHMENGKVKGYTILPPGSKVYTGQGEYYFQVDTSDGIERLYRDDVMTLRYSRSPKNLDKGVSPATAVRAWAQAEDVLAQYERAFIENGAIPASITFVRASSWEKFEQTRKELEHDLRGASNHGKTIYVWRQFNNDTGESLDQVEVKTIQGNNSTLAIKELTDIINDHINKSFGVSNFILGDDSSAKYDNAELSDYQFIRRRVFPALMKFWNQFQFELDRVTGGLGYGIQFEIELPDLTERQKVQAEIDDIRVRNITNLINAGSMPADAVKALNLSDEWLSVARGIWRKALVSVAFDKQKVSQNNENKKSHLPQVYNSRTPHQNLHTTCCHTSATDELPPMTADERKIYDALVAMAERIFANTPNIDEEGVIAELEEVLQRRAELGGADGGKKLAKLLKNKAVAEEIKQGIRNLKISGTLKDRIHERTELLVNNFGLATKDIMEEVLENSAGKSASEIKSELRQVMPTWQAERIARTETVYAFKSGRLDEDKAIAKRHNLNVKLVWRCRHDGDTCDVCAGMDGQTVSLGEAFADHVELEAGTKLVNGNILDQNKEISWSHSIWNDHGEVPAAHPNCRCWYEEIIEE